jgi:hypothetical protein
MGGTLEDVAHTEGEEADYFIKSLLKIPAIVDALKKT